MDFDLSDDQLALRDGARALLDDLASPERVRAHTDRRRRVRRRAVARDGRAGLARHRGPRSERRHRPRRGRGRGAARGARPPRRARAVRSRRCSRSTRSRKPATTTGSARLLAGDARRVRRVGSRRAGAVRAVGRRRGRAAPTTACTSIELARRGRAREPAMDLTRELGWLAFDPPARARLGGADARAPARSTAARPSRPPTCSAARRARSTWRSSTRRTACSSAARSARSKP